MQSVEGRPFVLGKHIFEWCLRFWKFDKTSTVAPRKHIKTTTALGYLAWLIYRMSRNYSEWIFMSYKEDLAEYHIGRLKRYIEKMPIFKGYASLTDAAGVIHMAKNGREFKIIPGGILSFKRGMAPYGVVCDDILKDPDNRMSIDILLKVERIFREEIISLPTNELHVIGTPQDDADLFAYLETKKEFNSKRYTAEVDKTQKVALWPEEWNWDRLQTRRSEIGDKAFEKEFNCRPIRSEEMFINRAKLLRLTCARLKNYTVEEPPRKLKEYTYGGLDIGKKTHPSHLSIFGVRWFGEHAKLVQIHSKWMDGWDYQDQVEYCKRAIKAFDMDCLMFDATRGEFESFSERGEIPDFMFPVCFTAKNKYSMATELDVFIGQERILFLKDERQTRQMLAVDNDLQAIETAEGHGDSFWSNCLALAGFQKAQGVNVWQP